MYGHLNVILKTFLRDKYGSEKWQTIVSKSGCAANYDTHALYDDEATKRLIAAAVNVLNVPRDNFLVMLGEFYLDYIRRIGHDELLRNLGENMLDFLENLDYVHTYMMSDYPDINMPSFRCEADSQRDKMVLHYYSFREGYYPIVIGILRRAANIYFRSELRIELISKASEEVANQKGKREHVILSIYVTKIQLSNADEPPPTLVAQTKKHGEKQILQEDIDRVIERLEQIKREQGDEALPLNKAKAVQTKWKAIAKMSILYGGFNPQYPQTLSIDVRSFCNAFPYHLMFDKEMEIVQSGVKIQQLMPTIRNKGARVDVFFELLHPHSVTFKYEHIQKFINTPFVLRTRQGKMEKNWGKKPMVILRGQMLYIEDHDLVMYLCSPFVRCLNDLEERKMYIADIPIHDVTRDMLWLELMSRFKYGKEHHSPGGGTANGTSGRAMVGVTDPNSSDVGALRAELARTQAALEAERRKNQMLYYTLLPRSTADEILAGKSPVPGQYKNVSVLFSDIVSFSQMVKSLKPIEVCDMLTKLHTKFNRLCLVHDTYRVGAIGDAYMVLSGAPDQVKTHAERIANVALGMRTATREVTSPFKYRDGFKGVQVRIGIHCGPIVAGVVGERLPRYLVFGETVNVASRMESHGEPGKIHMSGKAHDALKGRGFTMEKRDKIDIRGMGSMTTYFLIANEKVSADDIMGRKSRVQTQEGVEVTFINEGKRQYPPPSTRGGTPQLLRNLVTSGHSGDNSPTGPTTPLTPPEDNYVAMMYADNTKATGHRK